MTVRIKPALLATLFALLAAARLPPAAAAPTKSITYKGTSYTITVGEFDPLSNPTDLATLQQQPWYAGDSTAMADLINQVKVDLGMQQADAGGGSLSSVSPFFMSEVPDSSGPVKAVSYWLQDKWPATMPAWPYQGTRYQYAIVVSSNYGDPHLQVGLGWYVNVVRVRVRVCMRVRERVHVRRVDRSVCSRSD